MNMIAHALSRHCRDVSGMAIDVKIRNRSAHITMSGRFDYHAHRDFRKSYISLLADPEVREIQIEMNKVDYMDIPALAMLLLLNERAMTANKRFVLLTAPGALPWMIDATNFIRAFNIRQIGREAG